MNTNVLAPWVAMISTFIVLTYLFLYTPVLEADSATFKRLDIWQSCCDGRFVKLIDIGKCSAYPTTLSTELEILNVNSR